MSKSDDTPPDRRTHETMPTVNSRGLGHTGFRPQRSLGLWRCRARRSGIRIDHAGGAGDGGGYGNAGGSSDGGDGIVDLRGGSRRGGKGKGKGKGKVEACFLVADSMVDHFRVVRLVGRGGMGEVYLARDTLLNRRVALKIIHPRYLDSEEAVARFVREAQLTAGFSHPHIVTVHTVGRHEGRPYLAMEYLEGQNLRQRMQEERPGVRESLRIGLAIAQALVEAHRHRVLHRDLKPENVVLAKDGRLRIVDLGLAKVRTTGPREGIVAGSSARSGEAELGSAGEGGRAVARAVERSSDRAGHLSTLPHYATAIGTVQGTPAYMAPEQWRGEECSEAMDIWAFGVILHELIAGRRPYEGGKAFVAALVTGSEPVRALVPTQEVPAELVELIGRCLEKDAARRPPAVQVVAAIEQLLTGGRRQGSAEQSPFRGLFPFGERHADLFCGRDSEVAVFLESLREQAVLPVVGPSGAGKSSFVQAGVIPRLREQGAWTVLAVRPGANPFDALAARLVVGQSSRRMSESVASAIRVSKLRSLGHLPGADGGNATAGMALLETDDVDALANQLWRTPASLGVLLHDWAAEERCRVLLFVDQLEETFTMVADRAMQRAFLRAICGVADHPSSPVRAVFTVRDDFLGHVEGGPEVSTALTRVFVLRRPGKEALEETLTRPLTTAGYAYDDPSLPAEMVDSVEGEPACLPLLQFAGQMLWERRDRNRRLLCRVSYQAIGGVAGSLAEHADGVLAAMTPGQVELARQLLLRLVTSAGTRRVVPLAEVVAGLGPGVEEVLNKLTQARLLTVRRAVEAGRRQQGGVKHRGVLGGEAVLELVHESLLRTWTRLARWLEESKEERVLLAEIGQAAELWERRGCRQEEAWQGDDLHEARSRMSRLGTAIPDSVARFLEAGIEREQRAQRRKRSLLTLAIAGLAAVAIVAVLVAQLTFQQKRVAETERSEAQTQRADA
ncbi:MAG: serine/threonine-protein kinase [Pseudomonadota bacterium]